MAYFPIAFIAPNYRDYNDYWLKAYEPGTTAPKAMALDSAAAVTVAKLQLNADGFLKSAGGALVIPYLSGAYDLWLFPTAAEADSNTTTNAIRLADNITGVLPDDAIEALLINDLSQAYEFDNVAAMKASSIVFRIGKTLITKGYFSSRGGARYTVAASQTVDGFGDHVLQDAKVALLEKTNQIKVAQYGVDVTGFVESSDALQAAVYAIPSLFDEVKELVLEGIIKINKGILFYALDGLRVSGGGKISARIVPDGAMTPVLDADFQALQDLGVYDYSFPACFIVSAARRTGKSNWAVVTVNTAQWHMAFEDFTILRGTEDRIIAGIHCPRIGNSKFENILFKGLQSGIRSQDIYTTAIKNCFFTKIVTPIDHYSTGSFAATGTSMHIANCGITDAEYGWKFNKMFYSSMTACGCDGWARYQPAGDFAPTSFAYELNGCSGFVLTACGAEDPVLDRMKGLFKFTGGATSSVIVDGGAYVISDVPSTNVANLGLCVFDSQSVTLRAPTFLLNTAGGKIPYCDVLSGDVIVETLNQAIEWRRLFNFDNAASTARLLGNDPLQLAAVEGFRLFDEPFLDNGTTAVEFGVSDLDFANGRSGMWDNKRFTAPYAGAWKFDVSILATGAGLTYLALQRVGGGQSALFEYDPSYAGRMTYCPSQTFYLDKGDEIEVTLRTAVGATGNLKNAQISITQVR
tara:strand:+ start:2891 stop:4966 length:2076 start_codon:yes stop_codon:yes gene_type:complete